MRTEKEIRSELDGLLADYRANAPSLTSAQISAHNDKVALLYEELNAYFIQGAIRHEECGEFPIQGVRVREDRVEIGCDTGATLYRSRGYTQADAVEKWNAKEWYVSPEQIEQGRAPDGTYPAAALENVGETSVTAG